MTGQDTPRLRAGDAQDGRVADMAGDAAGGGSDLGAADHGGDAGTPEGSRQGGGVTAPAATEFAATVRTESDTVAVSGLAGPQSDRQGTSDVQVSCDVMNRTRWIGLKPSHELLRLLALAVGAAGITGAFNTPIAGV